jgi:hypothetical protein
MIDQLIAFDVMADPGSRPCNHGFRNKSEAPEMTGRMIFARKTWQNWELSRLMDSCVNSSRKFRLDF